MAFPRINVNQNAIDKGGYTALLRSCQLGLTDVALALIALPDTAIQTVEEKLRHHMESQALGTPLEPDRTVKSVVGAITACQGAFIVGPADATFAAAAASIAKMLTEVPVTQSPRGGTHVQKTLADVVDIKTLVAENSSLKGEIFY